MKRWFICVGLLLGLSAPLRADEGMWMVHALDERLAARLDSAGLRLDVDELYDEGRPSLSDAVVAFDGGVGSGSVISDRGLVITNHHVAYGDICALSTSERDLLRTGFWARTAEEELPVEGRSVWFLRRTLDVTRQARQLRARMEAEGRWGPMSLRRLYAELERLYGGDSTLEVRCTSLWGGERYLLHFYEVYRDVRLVGCPPASVGAFGGDADNWSWPQHKGDFALYRVYADSAGRPADYSPRNRPLNPRRVLTLSRRGVREGDFTLVLGYPGRTERYAPSYAVAEKQQVENPVVVANRQLRRQLLARRMERSGEVRRAYADEYFSLSNFTDLARWENRCLQRFDVVARRAEEERRLAAWLRGDSARRAAWGDVCGELQRLYAVRRTAQRQLVNMRESWFGASRAWLVANRLAALAGRLERQGRDSLRAGDAELQSLHRIAAPLQGGYDAATDRALLSAMTERFTDSIPRALWGEAMAARFDAAGGDAARMAAEAFDRSVCSDARRFEAFFAGGRSLAEIRRDALVELVGSVSVSRFTGAVREAERRAGGDLHEARARYARALYAFRRAEGRLQYPDANSTMRLSYGRVRSLAPSDGVSLSWRSTAAGLVEKYDPGDERFRFDSTLRRLLSEGAWGAWGEEGVLTVNFLTDNDITGGSSGSPVLDARGRLVGLAFDGNRESMAGNFWYHPDLARTVCVDIRFVMWTIERYAGADWLLRELRFE